LRHFDRSSRRQPARWRRRPSFESFLGVHPDKDQQKGAEQQPGTGHRGEHTEHEDEGDGESDHDGPRVSWRVATALDLHECDQDRRQEQKGRRECHLGNRQSRPGRLARLRRGTALMQGKINDGKSRQDQEHFDKARSQATQFRVADRNVAQARLTPEMRRKPF
jgi:hypothetical protein